MRCLAAWIVTLLLSVPLVGAQHAVPEGNRADLAVAPPRPAPGDVDDRARRCLDAIVDDAPDRAADFFLPREAFRLIKATNAPDPLWDRLFAAYQRDIHALHAALFADASGTRPVFVRLEASRRRGWVAVREEANRLPYWAQRHNWLVYRVGDQEHRIEVRTMIAWDGRWYVTHLSEFH